MRKLSVYIEKEGKSIYVGDIIGNDSSDACFSYQDSYIADAENPAISISLPRDKKTFDANQTRTFFEGLLPEGFTRRCVAEWMRTEENDYLSILSGLGRECLGAIQIIEEDAKSILPAYRRLSEYEVWNLAREGAAESAQLVAKSHLSLTGASGKVGLYYKEDDRQWYQPLGEAPSTHIVKQSHVRLKKIVTNEQLCLLTARKLGLETPDSFIVRTGSLESEEVLFATKRYDRMMEQSERTLDGLIVPYRLHQEDFAQALGIPAARKYEKNHEKYLRRMFDLLQKYSANPIEDQLKLWDICIFNYLIGNTDNHIKNVSLLYGKDLKTIRLAPAYDMISTMIYETSTEDMALSIGGRYHIREISKVAFEEEARSIGLGTKMAMKRFDQMVGNFKDALSWASDELGAQGFDQVEIISSQILSRGGISSIIR